MSENTHANVETEALEQDVTQKEQVEAKQEKTERTFTRAEIGKMLAAERAKWEDEQAEIIEQAKSEGERLAKMTKDERAKEEEARRIQAIEERERVLAEKEMRVATQTLLSEEGLPVEFLDFVISETAEVTKEKIGLLRSVFDKAVESRVDERLAQKVLAREVVTLVHGEEAYKEALNITEQLFAGNIKNLSVKELKQGLRGVPNYQVQADENLNIVEILVSAGVVNSKRQAREDVQNGAIYVNGDRIQDLDYVLSSADKLENELTVIRRGKKKYFVLTY